MFVVFGFMAAGVLTGWLLRRHRAGWTGKVMMALIWLLLLILGVEVGSDRRIVESLPTLGVEAAVIAVVSLLGSCLAALLLVRWFGTLAPMAAGGATTADVTLPVITRYSGEKYSVLSIYHGFVVDFTVPFLVTFFCSL